MTTTNIAATPMIRLRGITVAPPSDRGKGRPRRQWWQQPAVHAGASPLGSGMQADVDSGVRGIGCSGALIQGEVDVGVAQQDNREAALLEFVAKQAGESECDVFFGEGIGQGGAALIAAVGSVDYGKNPVARASGGCRRNLARRRWLR